MKCPHKAHVAVVDGERFVLLRNIGKLFEPKLQAVEEPELDPSNYSAGVRHQDSSSGNTDLDELAHAAAAAEWLNSKVLAGEIEQLLVIADAKTLGEMRHHYHKELQGRLVGELAKALTGEPIQGIEKAIANG